jgi:hypothetical protein
MKKRRVEKLLGESVPDNLIDNMVKPTPAVATTSPSKKTPFALKRLTSDFIRYRDSIDSITHLIDKGDSESLKQLLSFVQGDAESDPEDFGPDPNLFDSAGESSSLQKHTRRGSLPSISSVSLSSVPTLDTPISPPTDFQQRRRRVAKLSSFFGVSYHDLFGQVLESIETGVQDDTRRGTLTLEEAQELLARLRTLKAKKDILPFGK